MVVGKIIISLVFILAVLFSSGCLTEGKPEPVATPLPTTVPMKEIVNESQPLVKVEIPLQVESEQDWMYRNGGRYLHENWTVNRDNVSGYKDLILNIEIYGYRFMTSYRESGADSWGTNFWFDHIAPRGQKFLFVFIKEEMEGTDQRNDPRMWGFDGDNFAVQYKDSFVPLDPDHNFCLPIKELEHVGTYNNESRVSDFGKIRVESLTNPTGKASAPDRIEVSGCGGNTEIKTFVNEYHPVPGTGGVECQDLAYLRMGASNLWSGYRIYLVPELARPEDIKVIGAFGGFGQVWWTLKEKPL